MALTLETARQVRALKRKLRPDSEQHQRLAALAEEVEKHEAELLRQLESDPKTRHLAAIRRALELIDHGKYLQELGETFLQEIRLEQAKAQASNDFSGLQKRADAFYAQPADFPRGVK